MTNFSGSKKILIPRFDSHGDIILFSGFITALIEKLPDAEITILVRAGHEQLSSLLPSHINWVTTKIFPYKPFVSDDVAELNRLLHFIEEGEWDILLTTCYTRTWVDYVIAAKLRNVRRYAIGNDTPEINWIKQLLNWLSLPEDNLWNHYVEVEQSTHETQKYAALLKYLFDDDYFIPLPKLYISNELDMKASDIIKSFGLEIKNFFVCLPAGTVNISIKCWPVDLFVDLILKIQVDIGLIPLLIGHESEKGLLNQVAQKVAAQGGKTNTWVGRSGELHILAAIMQKSRFYVGNDSGPMHMATAVGIPTVGVFGGGYWPRFLPVGTQSVGVASLLPCFGCDWNCTFEDAPCVKIIKTDHILDALNAVLRGVVFEKNMMLVEQNLSHDVLELISKANSQYTRCKSALNNLANEDGIFNVIRSCNKSAKDNIFAKLRALITQGNK